MMLYQSAPAPVVAGWVVAEYNVTDTTSATTILGSTSGIDVMEVDGTSETLAASYQFQTTGSHEVRYKLSDRTAVPASMFSGVVALTSVTLPQSLTSIGGSCFFGCTALAGSIVVPSGVTQIEVSCFRNCSRVTEIDLPSTITSLGMFSAVNCDSLLRYIIRATSVPTYGYSAISGASGLKIYVPYSADHSILAAYQAASGWSAYASKMYELNPDGTLPN